MNEPNPTPPGRLAEYLTGDLGPARRHIAGLIAGNNTPCHGIFTEIFASLERCVRRIERDFPKPMSNQSADPKRERLYRFTYFNDGQEHTIDMRASSPQMACYQLGGSLPFTIKMEDDFSFDCRPVEIPE